MNRLEKAAARRALAAMPKESGIDKWMEKTGGRFEEAYHHMRALTGFSPEVCMLGAWMSLGADDRGEKLRHWSDITAWLSTTRPTISRWRSDYRLDEWAEQLRLIELRGQPLGEVDRVTYLQAVDPNAPVDARRLFYQRAGVLGQDITVHDTTQKEKLTGWLSELREIEAEGNVVELEVEDDGTLAELGTEAGDVSPA